MRVVLTLTPDEAKAANVFAESIRMSGGIKGFGTRREDRAVNAVLRKLKAATATESPKR